MSKPLATIMAMITPQTPLLKGAFQVQKRVQMVGAGTAGIWVITVNELGWTGKEYCK